MTLKFKPFEPFEIPETETVKGGSVTLDEDGDLTITHASGDMDAFGPEQWKILTERVQVEEEPEPWEKVRAMLIRFGFLTPESASRLRQADFLQMAEVLGLKSPGA